MNDRPRRPFHRLRTPLLLCMASLFLACLGFQILYGLRGADWLHSASVTCGAVAWYIALRFLAPAVLFPFFHRRYDIRDPWFRPRPWEGPLYEELGVKRWKKDAPTYEPDEFSLRKHTTEEIVENMCHAELVHEITILLSVFSPFLAFFFGGFPIFLGVAVLSILIECPFIIIQRYNRPRLVRLLKRKKKL